RPGAAVARVDVAHLGVELPAGQRGRAGQLEAPDPGFVHVDQREVHVVADQLVDVGLERIRRPGPAAAGPGEAHVDGRRLLRRQVRVAPAARVVEVVEGRDLEAGAGAGREAQAMAELEAVAQAAGGVAAELLVVVVADAGLEAVGAEVALPGQEHAGVVAVAHGKGGAPGHAVAHPVHAGAQHLGRAERHVALHRRGVATGVDGAGEAARAGVRIDVVRGGLVVGAADAHRQAAAFARAPRKARAQHLLAVVGFVAAEDRAVVLVERVGHHGMPLELQPAAERGAGAQAGRGVAVAVAVGLVGVAARAPARGGAAAGVDAVGALPRALGVEPAAPAARADARGRLAQSVAAGAEAGVRAQARGAVGAPGEDLDHAADGLGAV